MHGWIQSSVCELHATYSVTLQLWSINETEKTKLEQCCVVNQYYQSTWSSYDDCFRGLFSTMTSAGNTHLFHYEVRRNMRIFRLLGDSKTRQWENSQPFIFSSELPKTLPHLIKMVHVSVVFEYSPYTKIVEPNLILYTYPTVPGKNQTTIFSSERRPQYGFSNLPGANFIINPRWKISLELSKSYKYFFVPIPNPNMRQSPLARSTQLWLHTPSEYDVLSLAHF